MIRPVLVVEDDRKIAILTSKSSEEDRAVGFALGADDYVVRPFSPRELVSRVKAVLKRRPRRQRGGELGRRGARPRRPPL